MSIEGYTKDIKIEQKFSDAIKNILAQQFIVQDSLMDTEHGTDFLTFTVKSFKVGARFRRYEYFTKYDYRNEFTIRWKRPSGVKTEIDKIREGLVQYILYGFINEEETEIIQYFIGDLEVFKENEPEPFRTFPNNPPDSELAVFKINQLPSRFIVKQFPIKKDNEGAIRHTNKKLNLSDFM